MRQYLSFFEKEVIDPFTYGNIKLLQDTKMALVNISPTMGKVAIPV
jgi:hypothetical protein